MNTNRRQFLACASGWAAWGCGSSETPAQSAESVQAAFELAPYVVGANTAITGWGFFDAVKLVEEIGFRTIEVQNLMGRLEPTPGSWPGFRWGETPGEDRERIVASLRPFEYVTVHLPYPESTPYIEAGAEKAVRALERELETAESVGARLAVLHPQPHGTDLYADWATAVERIRRWGSMAADRGFKLACETGTPNSVPDLVRFVEEIGHDNVGVTLDVGHQAGFEELAGIEKASYAAEESVRAYNDLNIKIVESLGEKLIHFHVHDIEPETWAEHKPLIHGFIDYPRLIGKLREIEYAGVLVFEIGGDADKMPGYLRDAKSKLDGYIGP